MYPLRVPGPEKRVHVRVIRCSRGRYNTQHTPYYPACKHAHEQHTMNRRSRRGIVGPTSTTSPVHTTQMPGDAFRHLPQQPLTTTPSSLQAPNTSPKVNPPRIQTRFHGRSRADLTRNTHHTRSDIRTPLTTCSLMHHHFLR
jgi:hypothetical protein